MRRAVPSCSCTTTVGLAELCGGERGGRRRRISVGRHTGCYVGRYAVLPPPRLEGLGGALQGSWRRWSHAACVSRRSSEGSGEEEAEEEEEGINLGTASPATADILAAAVSRAISACARASRAATCDGACEGAYVSRRSCEPGDIEDPASSALASLSKDERGVERSHGGDEGTGAALPLCLRSHSSALAAAAATAAASRSDKTMDDDADPCIATR